MNNSQVKVPRYRENSLIIPFSMLCPGISQNTKHHHLTLYKGQVWEEKSYLEFCDQNILEVVYYFFHSNIGQGMVNDVNDKWPIRQNAELYIPPVPGYGFINDMTKIPYDSEMLQSFAELTNINNITFHSFDYYEDSLEDVTYQIQVGSFMCSDTHNYEQCVPPCRYDPWYIWTKEGFKMQMKLYCLKTNRNLQYSHILNLPPSIHHKDPE